MEILTDLLQLIEAAKKGKKKKVSKSLRRRVYHADYVRTKDKPYRKYDPKDRVDEVHGMSLNVTETSSLQELKDELKRFEIAYYNASKNDAPPDLLDLIRYDILEIKKMIKHQDTHGGREPQFRGNTPSFRFGSWRSEMRDQGAVDFEDVEMDTVLAIDANGQVIGSFDKANDTRSRDKGE